MKNTFFLITVMLLSAYSANSQVIKQPYIEVKHTGAEDKHIKSLLISTENLNIDISKQDAQEGLAVSFRNQTNLTKEQKQDILNLNYDFAITDKKTFSNIIFFVNTHPKFLTNSTHKNHGDYQDYAIIINGKTYNIYYKYLPKYFDGLILYLEKENCDNQIIQKLKFYSQ